MASSGERRMLFDTRGKRKHVIRVVYAILALLMGASLFLVVGPFNLANILGGSNSSGSSAATVLHEQAERIERRLVKSPDDEQLLLALTRARINAGNAQVEPTGETEAPTVSAEAREDFTAASEAWARYLKQTKEPSASGAQLVASTYFRLAESGSTSLREIQENVAKAAKAQRIAVAQQPSLGAWSSLAIYEYFAGDFAAGEDATKRAVAESGSKSEAKAIEEQLAAYRKRAGEFQKSAKRATKQEQKAGKEALQNPLGIGGAVPGG
jgi:hypothetical protein